MDDHALLRELAYQYVEICNNPVMDQRRDLWRKHNSLKRTSILLYVRAFAWQEMSQSELFCEDPFLREYENFFRQSLFRYTFMDDFIIEPWVTVQAVCVTPPNGVWGLASPRTHSDELRGSFVWDAPIKTEEDITRLHSPNHKIDEDQTQRRIAKLMEAIGDIVTINVDRGPAYRMWEGDISTQLAYLRGLEQVMWDMMDRPDWLHKFLAFMRDGILRTHKQAEVARLALGPDLDPWYTPTTRDSLVTGGCARSTSPADPWWGQASEWSAVLRWVERQQPRTLAGAGYGM